MNISVVYGTLPRQAISKMRVNHKALDPDVESLEFFAAGLSLVVHPINPMAPTVHLNYRYFETANEDGSTNAWWFGGGTDLTPSYLFDEDVIHFHRHIKDACDKHDKEYYSRFKKWCDEYFYIPHRGESRGVCGIFFDDLDETVSDKENTFAFVQDALKSFAPNYISIINKRKDMPFTEKGEGVAADSQGQVCRVQPGARSRHRVWLEYPRCACGEYPHELAVDGEVGVHVSAGAEEQGGKVG